MNDLSKDFSRCPRCAWCGGPMTSDHPECEKVAYSSILPEQLEEVLSLLDGAACVEKRGAAHFIREKLGLNGKDSKE